MARIRTIKPEFWTDEDLSELPPETHMLAAALLNYADDEGYFNANPKLVKATCCPLREDSTNIRRGLELLAGIGYIQLGQSEDGKEYGCIPNFLKHQRVDRPTASKIKEIDINWEGSTNPRRILDEPSLLEGKGREGKGKEVEGDNAGTLSPPASPNEGREDQGELSGSKEPTQCPHDEIIALYHEILPMCPHVRKWNKTRQSYLRQRWRENSEHQNLEWWSQYFTWVSKSKFLIGQTTGTNGRPPFVADLEWLINDSNMTKVIEGKYHQDQAA